MSELPANWATVMLCDAGTAITGNTPATSNPANYGQDLPFIKPPDLENRVIDSPQTFLSNEGATISRTLPPLAVLVTCIGNLGRVGISRTRVAFNQQINAVIPSAALDSFFLFYVAQSHAFRTQLESKASATTISIVNKGNFEKIPIPLPPLPEQKRIVAKIEELFSELEAGEASLRKARRQLGVYRQSLLKQAFEGKLTSKWRTQNPDKLESPASLLARIQSDRQAHYEKQLKEWEEAVKTWTSSGQKGKRSMKPSEPATFATKAFEELEIPAGWAAEQIGNCPSDALIGLVRSSDEQHTGPTGFSYIKMDRVDMLGNADVKADVFVDCTSDEVDRFALRKGDILFNTRNSVELVGKVGIVRRDPETPTVYNNNLMRLRLPGCIDPVFVGLQLCAHPFRQRMEKVKKATTSVAAVYGKDFWPLPIVLCSLPEQQEIVHLLDEQYEAIERNERELDAALQRSEALRQAILKKAFSGRLVPQDPADEPASALLARLRTERAAAPTISKSR